jgi:hypothetical protein
MTRKPYTRYPWRAWLKPGTFTARRGADFSGSVSEFLATVRAVTRGMGVKIGRVELGDDHVVVTIEDRATAPKYVRAGQAESDPFGAVA